MTVIPMSYAVGRSLAILILCLAASLTTLYAGEPWVTVNPGLRFGHVFGEGGGFVAGVEVMCRIGLAVPGRFHARHYHPTALTGSFAAASPESSR